VWLGIIAFESTDELSSEHTTTLLYWGLTHLFGRIDPASFVVWHHYLRKTGHVFGYAMLSYLLFRAWRATLSADLARFWEFRWAVVSFLSAAAVASLDEWHQTFIPSRTGSARDVLLDSVAALAAQLLLYIALRYKSVKHIQEGVAET
jgi:VanZ family protein